MLHCSLQGFFLFAKRCRLKHSKTREKPCYDNVQVNQVLFDVASGLFIQKLKYAFWRQFITSVYKQAAILFYVTGNTGMPSGSYIEFWSLLNEKCPVFLRKLYNLEHGNCLMNRYAEIISHKQSVGIFYGYANFTHLYTTYIPFIFNIRKVKSSYVFIRFYIYKGD